MMDYSNQNLSNADFSNRQLTGADFSYATLSDTNFDGANLSGVKFQHSNLTGVSFINANLASSDFTQVHLNKVNFSSANLENSDFIEAKAIDSKFSKTNIRGCNFCHTSLINANFKYAETGVSWIEIFELAYEALAGQSLDDATTAERHLSVSSLGDDDPQTQSIRKLPILILISLLLNWIFLKAVITDYQNHHLSSFTVIVAIVLLSSIYSSLQIVRVIKKQSGTCFQNADLSSAKFNYALIANTDFTNATITNVDWRNSRSKADDDEIV